MAEEVGGGGLFPWVTKNKQQHNIATAAVVQIFFSNSWRIAALWRVGAAAERGVENYYSLPPTHGHLSSSFRHGLCPSQPLSLSQTSD